jgi:hypothetical protein
MKSKKRNRFIFTHSHASTPALAASSVTIAIDPSLGVFTITAIAALS